MEELRDLQQIYKETAEKFNQYNGKDFVLPQLFKDTVREINSNKIIYNEYSAILTSGAQMNIYLPNQWFFIASYFTDFYNELQKYKSIALEVATKERLKDLNGGELSETEMSNVNNLDFSETSKSYLVKFITQYAWWGGAKTIDRGDFYVSPILNCAKLVNASQSFVADLCAFLSDKEELVNTIISGQEKTFIKHKELLRHNKAATFLRKALLITEDKDFDLMRLAALNLYERTAKRLKINGFTFGCDADKLPPRKADVDENVSWTYDSQKYVLYLEWNPDEMETLFFPAYNRAYTDLFLMKKEQDGDYVLYEINKETQNVINESDLPLQQIYYGAPGTGKSHTINEITKAQPEDNVVRTTFHPDSDYSTFVGAYKPTTKKVAMRDVTGKIIIENGKEVTEDRIVYEFVEQAFLQAYTRAWKLYASAADGTEAQPQYLIIEEINRGNCAQIFGDLFQLLDRDDSGFSEYPIKADNDMQKQLAKAFNGIAISNPDSINQWFEGKDIAQKVLSGEVLLLPKNLYIWATMNTSDQSLFPIDSAFKRRWDWKYVPIADAKKNWTITANGNRYDWWQFLEKINAEIEKSTHSEDKKLGYFFCKAKNGTVDAETFVGKVVFYLWNDVFKDFVDESGDLFKDDEGRLTFDKFYTIGADEKTKIVEAKIERFLQNLGVEPISDNDEDEDEDEDEDDTDGKNQRKETLLSIQIPNYPKMESSNSTQFDVFVDALKIIGIDKILPIVDNLKYERLNRPVLSNVKYPEIENNDKGYSYYQADGLYIIKGCKSYTYIRILEDLNQLLNIGLTLETK